MDYKQAKEYMASINCFGIVPGLNTIRQLLEALGNPQDKLKFIHIAGTNGKGSVGAYLGYILAASGYRVGRYVSPAVLNECEIIQILEVLQKKVLIEEKGKQKECFQKRFCQSMIEKDTMARHISRIKCVIDKMKKRGLEQPTVFEIETAMALLEFLEKDCDIVIFEAGMGGRLDATNIIETVECSIIVSISKDHMAFLGSTLEEIAEEKAGIIKENIPVVSSPQNLKVRQVLEKKAEEKNTRIRFADIHCAKKVLHILNDRKFINTYKMEEQTQKEKKRNGIYFTYENKEQWEIYIPLLGISQLENALVALNAIELLKEKGYRITEEAIKEGFSNTVWPGRFQILRRQPLLIVDGAHNEAAAEKLAESLKIYLLGNNTEKKGKLIYVLGIFKDKEIDKIIEKTSAMADIILTVKPNSPRGFSSYKLKEKLENFWDKIGKKGYVEDCKDIKSGLKKALELAEKEDTIIIFGSLSLLRDLPI